MVKWASESIITLAYGGVGGGAAGKVAGGKAVGGGVKGIGAKGETASIGSDFFSQTAQRSTHNPDASEVVLGRYVPDSPSSYEMVAQARGSTYFSMDDWNSVSKQVGADKMWNINQAFLEQQAAQGKSFVFTGNPYSAPAGSYTARELNFLIDNGYRVIPGTGGVFRAIKK